MVKRRNVIFGVAAFILVAGVVTVIVLASLGYFNKKSPVGSSTNTDFRPNANYVGVPTTLDPTPGVHPTGGYVGNCNVTPKITDVKYSNNTFTIYLSPSTPYYSCKNTLGSVDILIRNDGYYKTENIQAKDGDTVIYFTPNQPPTSGKKNATLNVFNGIFSGQFDFTFTA
jgi:hypothetical protein